MAKTIQKKINFSKGQIVPSLVERTDLNLFNNSAQVLKNAVSTVYGGIRSRRGTDLIDRILTGLTETTGTATSSLGTASYIQDKVNYFVTSAIGSNRELFKIDYGSSKSGGVFKIRGLKFDYLAPEVSCTTAYDGSSYSIATVTIDEDGLGLTTADTLTNTPLANWTTPPEFSYTLDALGKLTGVTIVEAGELDDGEPDPPNLYLDYTRGAASRSYNVSLWTSADDVTYVKRSTNLITETGQNFDINLTSSFRYVKLIIDTTADVIGTSLSFQYCLLATGNYVKSEVKLVDYIFNNQQKYVLVLANETINIYQDDDLVFVASATGLLDTYFDELKWSYKDDTIVFTHEDMRTKQLQRTTSGWLFSDFPYTNVPYFAFDGETYSAMTIGLTPSGTEGALKITADSGIFNSSWVGQFIDGNGGRFRISEYVSSTVVNGFTQIPFYTTDKITSWNKITGYEAVWSATRGYPRTCLFSQQRLWFGGSRDKPASIWGSRLGDYNNFKNSGNYDNDSIDIDLLTNDSIANIIENRGIHIFTTGQELTAGEGTLTPDKFSAIINTRNGSSTKIRPIVIGGVVAFIEKNGKSLLSYIYDYNQASYVTDNLSLYSNLIQSPVGMAAETNSNKDKGDFIFLVLEDGTMLVCCTVLSQYINSICQFTTDGLVKDVCSIAGSTYIIVDRGTYIYLEKISELNTDLTMTIPVYSETVSVLSDYEDKLIYLYDENKIYGTFRVNNAQITVPNPPNKDCYIGIPFEYEIESNPIAINNKTTSIKKRISKAELVCRNTPQITFNGQTKYNKDVYSYYACTRYDNDVRFSITGEFYKFEILSIELQVNYEE